MPMPKRLGFWSPIIIIMQKEIKSNGKCTWKGKTHYFLLGGGGGWGAHDN